MPKSDRASVFFASYQGGLIGWLIGTLVHRLADPGPWSQDMTSWQQLTKPEKYQPMKSLLIHVLLLLYSYVQNCVFQRQIVVPPGKNKKNTNIYSRPDACVDPIGSARESRTIFLYYYHTSSIMAILRRNDANANESTQGVASEAPTCRSPEMLHIVTKINPARPATAPMTANWMANVFTLSTMLGGFASVDAERSPSSSSVSPKVTKNSGIMLCAVLYFF